MPAPMDNPGMGQDMGPEESMGAPEMDDEGQDDELTSVLAKLSPEQKKAVVKYAQGIADEDGDDQGLDEDAMVTEITNNILDDGKQKPEDDKDQKVRNKKLKYGNPFSSKNFK
jgi:hypothetical protein